MADAKTVKELHAFLDELVKAGHGDAEILFDTEAKSFRYHFADVGEAHFDDGKSTGFEPHVTLHEADVEDRFQTKILRKMLQGDEEGRDVKISDMEAIASYSIGMGFEFDIERKKP